MLGTAGRVMANSYATFSNELLHMDTQVLANQQKRAFISSVQTLDAIVDLPRVTTIRIEKRVNRVHAVSMA